MGQRSGGWASDGGTVEARALWVLSVPFLLVVLGILLFSPQPDVPWLPLLHLRAEGMMCVP